MSEKKDEKHELNERNFTPKRVVSPEEIHKLPDVGQQRNSKMDKPESLESIQKGMRLRQDKIQCQYRDTL